MQGTVDEVEVRVVSGDIVIGYRVFRSARARRAARALLGRCEREVPVGPDGLPADVTASMPEDLVVSGHVMVTHVSRDESYALTRRLGWTSPARYIKFFSDQMDGMREAVVHDLVHSRFPDAFVAPVESGTIRSASDSPVPSPCVPGRCPDLKFYLVTEDPGEGFTVSNLADLSDVDCPERIVRPVLAALETMHRQVGFVHWDLHGRNLLINRDTGAFRMLDMEYSVVDPRCFGVCSDVLSSNCFRVPAVVLKDFGGSMAAFGAFYDRGRVLFHGHRAIADAAAAMIGTTRGAFEADYCRRIHGLLKESCEKTPDGITTLGPSYCAAAMLALLIEGRASPAATPMKADARRDDRDAKRRKSEAVGPPSSDNAPRECDPTQEAVATQTSPREPASDIEIR